MLEAETESPLKILFFHSCVKHFPELHAEFWTDLWLCLTVAEFLTCVGYSLHAHTLETL